MTVPHDVHVSFCLTSRLEREAIAIAHELLSDDERARCARFVFAHDRRDFAVAHALLRQSLSSWHSIRAHAWTFDTDSNGKPRLSRELAEATQLRFNLAHTHGLVACAISRVADVGVDVEVIGRQVDPLEIAERFFSAGEAGDLACCAPPEQLARFIEIWTLKEAYVKAVGSGLSMRLDEFGFRFDDTSALRFECQSRFDGAWSFALYTPSDRHRLAVAAWRAESVAPPRIAVFPSALDDAQCEIAAIECVRSVQVFGSRFTT